MLKRLAIVAGLLLTPCGAQAEDAAVLVTGQTPDQVQGFVTQITALPQNVDALGVWEHQICPSVTGLPQDQGQQIVDRISLRAAALGLRVGAPGCTADIFVFFVADADAFAHRLFEERREMFAYHRTSAEATRGRAALDDFLSEHRPVRWWHVMQYSGADGERIGDSESRSTASGPPPLDGSPPNADSMAEVQAVRGRGSRLQSSRRLDMARAIIIVDGISVAQIPPSALGDYLAMVALAQINPQADFAGVPTILSLFDAAEGARPTAMTAWDVAYLDGLYDAPRNATSARQQIAAIARRMSQSSQ